MGVAAPGSGCPADPSYGFTEQATDLTKETEDTGYAWRALSVVGLASILMALNSSALNTALPTVVRHFHASNGTASWILLSYLLVSTVLTLVFGRCADLFGRRRMYLTGLAVFTVASLGLGLAPSIWALIGLRVVQAAAGAALLTNSAAIVSAAFPERLLSRGMGIYLASFSVATLLGPTLGGLLTTNLGWRWVFWFNVPVGVVALLWGRVTLRGNPPAARFTGIDTGGNALFVLGLGGLLLALSEGASLGWTSPAVLAGTAAFVVLIPLFVLVEFHGRNPVIDPRLFTNRPFTMANGAAFINVLASSGVALIVALYFQAVRGDTPLQAGVAVLPMTASAAIGSSVLGGLSRLAQPRTIAAAGAGLTSLGLLVLLLTCGPHTAYPEVCAGIVITGLGTGVFMPANITSILAGTPADRLGVINAVRLMVQNSAAVVGTATCLTLLATPLPGDVRRAVYAGTIGLSSAHTEALLAVGYRVTYGVMFALSLAGVLASLASQRVHQRLRVRGPVGSGGAAGVSRSRSG